MRAKVALAMWGVFTSVPECIIEIDILGSWNEAHTEPPVCGVGSIIVGKGQMKPLKLSPHTPLRKLENHYHFPRNSTD